MGVQGELCPLFLQSLLQMPEERFELSCPKTMVSKTTMYTNSIIRASLGSLNPIICTYYLLINEDFNLRNLLADTAGQAILEMLYT